MKHFFLAAFILFTTATLPSVAAADDDASRAQSLTATALAQVLMGYKAYQIGDLAGALQAWEPVADIAPHNVQFLLGQLVAEGVNAAADPSHAITILTEPAEHGHTNSQFLIGKLAESMGSPGDYKTAANWYLKAATSGMAQAQNNLGVLYANDKVSPPACVDDYVLGAKYWFGLAAAQGFADAQFNLGILYQRGKAEKADPVYALAWLVLAARQGHNQALVSLNTLEPHLTPVQLDETKTLLDSGILESTGG